MGLGNRVICTVASAPGTGNIPIGTPEIGYIAFSDCFIADDPIEYWVEDGSDFEHGYGTYLAGNAIQRDTVIETLVGGVYDDSSPVAIDVSATAVVYVSASLEQLAAKLDLDGGDMQGPINLSGYTEQIISVASSSSIAVTLNGGRYIVLLNQNLTVSVIAPDNTRCGSAQVDFYQDPTGGHTVTFPATWFWADGTEGVVDATPDVRSRLILTSYGASAIDADLSVRKQP